MAIPKFKNNLRGKEVWQVLADIFRFNRNLCMSDNKYGRNLNGLLYQLYENGNITTDEYVERKQELTKTVTAYMEALGYDDVTMPRITNIKIDCWYDSDQSDKLIQNKHIVDFLEKYLIKLPTKLPKKHKNI